MIFENYASEDIIVELSFRPQKLISSELAESNRSKTPKNELHAHNYPCRQRKTHFRSVFDIEFVKNQDFLIIVCRFSNCHSDQKNRF